MRILLLSFYYPPDLSAGSFRAAALVRALREESGECARIDVVTSMPNRYRSMACEAPEREEGDGVTIRRVDLPSHRSGMLDQARAFAHFSAAVRRHTRHGSWDCVIATSSRLMTAALGAWVARRHGAPLYLDIRDLFTDTMADLLAGRSLRLLLPGFRRLERWTFRSAARLNVVSAGFLPHMQRIVPGCDCRVFTNGIDDEFLQLDFTSERRSDEQAPLVLYAGNMGEGQGLHHVVPAAARMLEGRARLRLIGDGGRRKALEAALAACGAGNVELLAPMPRNELYRHYREADVLFLHLNEHRAFHKVLPSKLFEYAATGKPVLAGVAGHAAEFVRQEIEGAAVFPPCDPQGLVDGLEKLIGEQVPDRTAFKEKFARSRIMAQMARDVLVLAHD